MGNSKTRNGRPSIAPMSHSSFIATGQQKTERNASRRKRPQRRHGNRTTVSTQARVQILMIAARKIPILIVRLPQSAVTIGPTSCYVAHVSVEPPGSVTLDANCEGLVTTVVLSKVDDQSLLLGESRPGQAARTNQSLSYCPPAAQRDFTESKAK